MPAANASLGDLRTWTHHVLYWRFILWSSELTQCNLVRQVYQTTFCRQPGKGKDKTLPEFTSARHQKDMRRSVVKPTNQHGTSYRPVFLFTRRLLSRQERTQKYSTKQESVWAPCPVRTLWRTGKFAQVSKRFPVAQLATPQPSHNTDNYQSQITAKHICLYLARANNYSPL